MKRTFALLLICVILFNVIGVHIAAASNDPIMPLWDYTRSVFGYINFSGTTGNFTAYVNGDSDVTDIIAFAKLYYKDSGGHWIEISKPWGFLTNSTTLIIDEDFDAESGVEYKVELEAYVYVGNSCDEITYTASKTCP